MSNINGKEKETFYLVPHPDTGVYLQGWVEGGNWPYGAYDFTSGMQTFTGYSPEAINYIVNQWKDIAKTILGKRVVYFPITRFDEDVAEDLSTMISVSKSTWYKERFSDVYEKYPNPLLTKEGLKLLAEKRIEKDPHTPISKKLKKNIDKLEPLIFDPFTEKDLEFIAKDSKEFLIKTRTSVPPTTTLEDLKNIESMIFKHFGVKDKHFP